MNILTAEAAIRAYEQGLVAWDFLPHGRARKDIAGLSAAEWQLAFDHECRDDALVSRTRASTRAIRKRHRKALFWYSNRCGIWPGMFEQWETNCIVIPPKWSVQGPNGSLVVTKASIDIDAREGLRTG